MKNRNFLICGLIIMATLVAGLVAFPHLPARVPSHWDIHGNVNGYSSRAAVVFVFPGIMAGIVLLFAALPALSPRHFEVETFRSTYLYLMLIMVAAIAYFHGLLLWAALSQPISMPRAAMGGVCVLIALVGNVLGKVKRNFYVGVRTPWTLANERVWYATHRLAGKLLVALGCLGLVLTFLLPSPVPAMLLICVGSLYPVLYSFLYYKRLEKQGAEL